MIHKMVEEEKSSVVMAVTTPEDPQESSKEQVEQLILSEQEEVTQPPTSTTTTTTTTTMPEEQLHIEAEKPEEEQTAVTVPESTVEEPLPLPLPEAATTTTATTTATQSIGEEKGEKATTTSEEKKPQEPSDSTTGPDEPEKPLELQMEPIEAERQQQQQQQSASSLSTAAADEEKVTLTTTSPTTAAVNKFPQRRGSAVTMTTTVKFIPPRQRRGSDLTDKVAMFNKKFTEHHEKQLANPFSDIERPEGYQFAKLDPSDPNYGKPVAGSMTELRGKKANQHMRKEWRTLCEVIYDCGYRLGDGKAMIRFGELFTMYNAISDKCVGNLLGARKHGYLTFEGEMLYQRRDEDTEITLLKPIKEIQALLPIIFDPSLPDNLQE